MIVSGWLRMGLIAIASCLAIASAPAQVVVFSTLTASTQVGADVIGSSVLGGTPIIWAASFISNGTFNLIDAKVNVIAEGGNPAFNVFLARDYGGGVDLVRNWRQIGFGLIAPSGGGLVTANSITTPITLTSGSGYWLVLTAANPQTRMGWYLGDRRNGTSHTAYNTGDDNFDIGWRGLGFYPLQFQIDGTPPPPATPLPPSLILSLLGLAGVGLYQMRRKLIT